MKTLLQHSIARLRRTRVSELDRRKTRGEKQSCSKRNGWVTGMQPNGGRQAIMETRQAAQRYPARRVRSDRTNGMLYDGPRIEEHLLPPCLMPAIQYQFGSQLSPNSVDRQRTWLEGTCGRKSPT